MNENKKKADIQKEDGMPLHKEASIPLLLCLVCMSVALVALMINACVYPFGNGLLVPALVEILAVAFPCYLVLLSVYPGTAAVNFLRTVGYRKIGAHHVFFMLFSALFMISVSMIVSVIFGGVYSMRDGFTLLGVFTAGENEFSVSWPYLVLVYAVIPAFCEELLLRGMVFSQLKGIGFSAAAAVSAVMSGLIGFSLGGFIPAVVSALLCCFVLYTTGSLWSCVIVKLAFNLYRLFWERNLSAYYTSTASKALVLVVMFVLLFLSGVLFFGESARIYRQEAERASNGGGERKTLSLETFATDVKAMIAHRPTLILLCSCGAVFIAAVVIAYLT
ncbi:MAG: CPBP family intramembrane metalloprotease [Clostridia bacterium]|nr:CPBP family intramembrane metalloprotease [Clostridia bacterium]